MDAPKPQDLTQAMAEALIGDLVRERRMERRWRWGFRLLFIGGSIVVSFLYLLLWAPQFGWRIGPFGDVVGVVQIDGEISQESLASAGRVVPALKKAFESAHVRAVVLAIDSPGGSPSEAERIYRAIESLRAEHRKPVIAVVGNVGASAAYLIALHADKIYAGQYSLVGSVGAVLAGWDLHRAAERLDVSQRLYASGPLKSMLSPFQPITEAADEKARALIREIGDVFVGEVKRLRGEKLSGEADVASGEVWLGPDAKRLGLIDEIGTLEEVIRRGWNLNWYDFGPRRQGGLFVAEAGNDLISEIVDRVISQARFQLR
jgi:protease IV